VVVLLLLPGGAAGPCGLSKAVAAAAAAAVEPYEREFLHVSIFLDGMSNPKPTKCA
jgi:hypothetical protein